jgi:hypothetical protein
MIYLRFDQGAKSLTLASFQVTLDLSPAICQATLRSSLSCKYTCGISSIVIGHKNFISRCLLRRLLGIVNHAVRLVDMEHHSNMSVVNIVASRPRFSGDSRARTPQLDRDLLYRTRQVLDRQGFLMSISIGSLPM